jgi:hypothetical protein
MRMKYGGKRRHIMKKNIHIGVKIFLHGEKVELKTHSRCFLNTAIRTKLIAGDKKRFLKLEIFY